MKSISFKSVLFVLSSVFLFNYTFGYSVTMCDDGHSLSDHIAGKYIGISIWNGDWSYNKSFTAPAGNCIHVTGLAGGDFVQFGKFFSTNDVIKPQPMSKNNTHNQSMTTPNLTDGFWCMTSQAATIRASGIETTSYFTWQDSGTCYQMGAYPDWQDSIWNIPPQNTGEENEQRSIITANTFVSTFQMVGLQWPDPGNSVSDLQIVGDNGFLSPPTNSNSGLFVVVNSTTSSIYYLIQNDVTPRGGPTYNGLRTAYYNPPIIIDTGVSSNTVNYDEQQYLCVANSSLSAVAPNWTITPEVVEGNDNYQSTVYPFGYGRTVNCLF